MAMIKHYVDIKAPAEKVYSALTEQTGLASWWTNETTAKPEVGFVIVFKFGGAHFTSMKVTKLVQNKLVCWDCVEGDKEWVGTKIQFELDENNGTTNLTFTHTGWASETLFLGICSFHWAGYMKSLRDYCETGKGIPNNNGRF
jgi:uncharacterized protein YndB with AHSA1/START domain